MAAMSNDHHTHFPGMEMETQNVMIALLTELSAQSGTRYAAVTHAGKSQAERRARLGSRGTLK
jgi:hypothetical protein